jgi:hypothetical protein
LLNIAEECRSLGVDLVSLKQNVDTTLPAGRLTFQILGAVAEFEWEMLRERVRAGMAQARRAGKHVGRRALRQNPAYNFEFTQFKDVQHKTIRHKDKVYVRGEVHTNTVESAFSLFKRGVVGAFHKVSLKHLQRYLNEFSFRFNNRKAPDLFGMTVARMALAGAMPYEQLIEENAFTPFVRR